MNVLLILAGNLNTQITPYTNTGAHTPNLARLAARGVVFDNAYAQHAQDGPSRASLLSGLYPERTGVVRGGGTSLQGDAEWVTPLPQHLREAGYWTGTAGRVFHKPSRDYGRIAWDAVAHEPDDHLPMIVDAYREFRSEHGAIHRAKTEWYEVVETLAPQTRGEKRPGYGPSGLPDAGHADGKDARVVADWLQNEPFGERPFFIAFGVRRPHVPFVVPDKYFKMYEGASFAPAAAVEGEWADRPAAALTGRFRQFGFRLAERNERLRRTYLQAYYASASFADAQIGVVLDALEGSRYAGNTMVIFASDVGFSLGDHWLWGKGALLDSCLRVPLIVATPDGAQAGVRSDAVVSLIDIASTIAESANATADQQQGSSLLNLERSPGVSYSITSRGSEVGRSIRTSRWRYTEWDASERAELYDHESDPHEFVNLADRREHSSTRESLRSELARWRRLASGARDP